MSPRALNFCTMWNKKQENIAYVSHPRMTTYNGSQRPGCTPRQPFVVALELGEPGQRGGQALPSEDGSPSFWLQPSNPRACTLTNVLYFFPSDLFTSFHPIQSIPQHTPDHSFLGTAFLLSLSCSTSGQLQNAFLSMSHFFTKPFSGFLKLEDNVFTAHQGLLYLVKYLSSGGESLNLRQSHQQVNWED